jgi:hypothetical protein
MPVAEMTLEIFRLKEDHNSKHNDNQHLIDKIAQRKKEEYLCK